MIEEFKFGTGVLEDTRSDADKAKDYKAEEVAMFAPVNWVEKQESDWRKFPIMNQLNTSSCVAHAVAKCIGIESLIEGGKYVDFSRRFIYAQRSNKPGLGMSFVEAMEYIRSVGIPPEALLPSENLTESEMNYTDDIKSYIVKVANVFKTLGYVQLPFDIEVIASTIQQTGKAILLGFSFDYEEWTGFPKIINQFPSLRHAVAGVDFTLYQGDKKILIEDSWGAQTAINGRRLINSEFIQKRCIFAGYFLNLAVNTDPDQPKPKHTFNVPMEYGQTNSEISHLQDILKYEELMADNIPSTGFFWEITRKALLKFQQKYEVDAPEKLIELNGTKAGPKTLQKLNEMYG